MDSASVANHLWSSRSVEMCGNVDALGIIYPVDRLKSSLNIFEFISEWILTCFTVPDISLTQYKC